MRLLQPRRMLGANGAALATIDQVGVPSGVRSGRPVEHIESKSGNDPVCRAYKGPLLREQTSYFSGAAGSPLKRKANPLLPMWDCLPLFAQGGMRFAYRYLNRDMSQRFMGIEKREAR